MHTSRGLRMSAFRRGVITTIALAAVLAGCTDEPPGPVPQPTSAPPTIAPSPTPTPIAAPVRPEAMNTASVDGAIAAAKYFMEVYTYARQTGDLTEWDALSATDCEFCNAVADLVTTAAAAGHTVTGSDVAVIESTGSEVLPGTGFSAQLRMVEGRSQEKDRSGHVVRTGPEEASDVLLALAWEDGWIVEAVDVSPTPTAVS